MENERCTTQAERPLVRSLSYTFVSSVLVRLRSAVSMLLSSTVSAGSVCMENQNSINIRAVEKL